MNDSSHINIRSYTQESNFEQAINNNIDKLWQSKEEGFLRSFDKTSLYWVKLTSEQHNKAIVIVNGRIECCLKYQELFYDLFQQGYDIYSFDHRGQGQSDRLIEDKEMGYVEEFDDYIQDLTMLVEHFDLSRYKKRYLIGHSMGGNIVTRYLQTQSHPFDAAALSAPMYGVNLPWYLKPVATLVGQVMTALQPKPDFAPGQAAYYAKPFEGNFLSQSDVRYRWFRDLYEQQPQLRIGGASARWVWQGLLSCKKCFLMTRHLKTPLLVMQAGNDEIVSNEAQIKLMKKLAKTSNQCAFTIIQGAKHELFFEQDEYRNQALEQALTFLEQH